MGQADSGDWPERTWLLAALGAAAGLAIFHLVDTDKGDPGRWVLAFATALLVGSFTFGVVLERAKGRSSLIFAAVSAVVVAAVIAWNGAPDDWNAAEQWRLVCAGLSVAIAAPLFQVGRAFWGATPRFPYPAVHDRAWTNVLLFILSWVFAGVVLLLGYLLAELFKLIGIHIVRDVMEEGWAICTLIGAALGGAVGLLRDRDGVLGTVQRVAMTVLSVLAPVLGLGLGLFVLALPFTGLAPLWDATRATTPILISTIIAAILLANAVIGDTPEEEARAKALRWGAIVLGVTILPLAVIAVISTGLRIHQYGLTPDRLWAALFTAIALAYALAYFVAVARGRSGWAGHVRPANLRLAFAVCGVAFLLSTPVLGFGALSTWDQVGRLKAGKVSAEDFDWAALQFDFGPSGKAAVAELAAHGATPAIRQAARDVRAAVNRWAFTDKHKNRNAILKMRIFPRGARLPKSLSDKLASDRICYDGSICSLKLLSANEAIVAWCGGSKQCYPQVRMLMVDKGKWVDASSPPRLIDYLDDGQKLIQDGEFEVRTVTHRQIFLNGAPIGDPFD